MPRNRGPGSVQGEHSTYMTLTHEDVNKILAILDESGCEEAHIEFGELKLHFRKHGSSSDIEHVRHAGKPDEKPTSPQATTIVARGPDASAAHGPRESHEQTIPEGVVAVSAPMLGTFYRAPSPGAAPFVAVGDKVLADDTVCLLEVMKLFNSIRAGVAGTVDAILVENATLVEYGQPLIFIRKEAA